MVTASDGFFALDPEGCCVPRHSEDQIRTADIHMAAAHKHKKATEATSNNSRRDPRRAPLCTRHRSPSNPAEMESPIPKLNQQ